MKECVRCGRTKDVITIPIELVEDNITYVLLCKPCILKGFKGVIEQLVEIGYQLDPENNTKEEILDNTIQSIPFIKE